ncbi:MAG: LIC_13355 family lipoprotein [Leptospiraceae bacterium]|nr:LIC_13355 family lipoprotein [Leptospiraceae bacterium]
MRRKIISLFIFLTIYNCQNFSDKKNINKELGLALFLASRTNSTNNSSQSQIGKEFADTVTLAPGHDPNVEYQDKSKAVNGVRGQGCCAGSLDVFSLATTGTKATIVLEWEGKKIINGEGIDFIVFENPFQNGTNVNSIFMEPSIVEVSIDGTNYCGFDPKYENSDQNTYSKNPIHWTRFAGINPVKYNIDTNPLKENDLFNLSKSGGDGFDLSLLSNDNSFNIGCTNALKNSIQNNGFIYLRITSATARINSNTGNNFLQDNGSLDGKSTDIDGVAGRYIINR